MLTKHITLAAAALLGALAAGPLACAAPTPLNHGDMLLNGQATCGADVTVYCVTFLPVDPTNGPVGCFAAFKGQSGAVTVEPMTVTLSPDQAVPGQSDLEGTSASLYVKATVDGTGYYVPSWTGARTGQCRTGIHPSGISVGN